MLTKKTDGLLENSSDMNEIILTPCDAGYVQSCTGFFFFFNEIFDVKWYGMSSCDLWGRYTVGQSCKLFKY
jgi:hypothetical protein